MDLDEANNRNDGQATTHSHDGGITWWAGSRENCKSNYRPIPTMPQTWAEHKWPQWVPMKIRKLVEEFWDPTKARGPQSWAEDTVHNAAPHFGSTVRATLRGDVMLSFNHRREGVKWVNGRYVHLWNNCGVIVPIRRGRTGRDRTRFYWVSVHFPRP